MRQYIKKVEHKGFDKELQVYWKASVDHLTKEEIEEANEDDSLDILFDGQNKEQACIDRLERLFDHISLCYENDIDFNVIGWLKEFIEEEEKDAAKS